MVNQKQLQQSVQQQLEQLEPRRLKIQREFVLKVLSYVVVSLIMIASCFVFAFNLSENVRPEMALFFTLICTTIPAALILFVAGQQIILQWKATVKTYRLLLHTKGYLPIFQQWNTTIGYYPDQRIPDKDWQASKLVTDYDHIQGDDYCEGQWSDGRVFRFSEIDVLKAETRWKGGRQETYYRSLFKGLFFVLEQTDLQRFLQSRLQLIAKPPAITAPERSLKAFFKPTITDILDANFEKSSVGDRNSVEANFSVVAKDSGTLKRLPTSVQRQLIQLKEHVNHQLAVAFEGDICYVAVAHEGKFWELPLQRSLLKETVQQELA